MSHSSLRSMGKRVFAVLCYFALPLAYVLLATLALVARRTDIKRPRLVWGDTPIINNVYWARAMRSAGFESETYTYGYSGSINTRADYDRILSEHYRFIPMFLRYFPAFVESLFRYDVFFLSFDGFFLGHTPYWWLESHLLRIAGKKVVVIPYGYDGYVYRRVRSTALLHGLLMSFPQPARAQAEIARKVDYWCRHCDVLIPGVMGPDGYGRWDLLAPSSMAIDERLWQPSIRNSNADGSAGKTVYVAHAPNHRGFKGSEFVVDAVRKLQQEGLELELLLIEKVPNSRVREILYREADILVEQLVATGHGLNALEGMASALPVMSNLEDQQYILPMRRWSFLNECPIVSTSPETLQDNLRQLVTRPELRTQLGLAGREYVQKYNSFDATAELFTAVIDHLYGRRGPLTDFCHPLKGEFRRHLPKITPPLKNGHLQS